MSPLKWLFINQLKRYKVKQKSGGFTLIELLVGIIIATLVITPLLGFMLNIMTTDRQEQAKENSELELKAALDFITRDLQQSVYIYDADGINSIRSQLPKSTGIYKDQYFPVLVFWKRQFIPHGLTLTNGQNADTVVGQDDTFVYSLVAYYLIQDNSSTWSNAARIGRFQISNGYGVTDTDKKKTRDAGFQLFNLQDEGDLKSKMNKWTAIGKTYKQEVLPLVDYIDQTKINATTNPAPTCAKDQQLLPNFSGASGDSVPTGNTITRGFYVCVESSNNNTADNTVAEVYLRGNALARIQNNNISFNQNNKIYFPQVSRRVQGRGFLFTQ